MKEVEKQILARRAEQLSRPKTRLYKREETAALLGFYVIGTRYALPLSGVESVARIEDVLTLPQAPAHIAGIIRRSGRATALINLRRFLQPAMKGIADANYSIVITAKGKRAALEVEDIEGVIYVETKHLLAPPENLNAIQSPFVSAVTKDGRCVINIDRFFEVIESTTVRSFSYSQG
jgi:chemotaxis signal transduction protein